MWEGEVPAEGLHNMRLSGKYVRVTSAEEISVSVAPLDFSKSRPLDFLAYKFDIVLRGRRQTMFENKLEGM